MANLTITAASVVASTDALNTRTAEGIAGEAIDAGEVVYIDSTDSYKLKLASAQNATEAEFVGIALNSAGLNQPVEYATQDLALAIGATVAVGEVYVVSATSGKIAPNADLIGADFVTIIGVGITTSTISFIASPFLRGTVAHA